MKILFDLYTTQFFVGGAGEYIRTIFYELIKTRNERQLNIQIVALMDLSVKNTPYPDLSQTSISQLNVDTIDIHYTTLKDIIKKHNIDKVFIGAAQYWGMKLDVEDISCPVICVVHDLMDEEFSSSHIKEYLLLGKWKSFLHFQAGEIWRKSFSHKLGCNRMTPIRILMEKNQYSTLITVSEYSKVSILYHYNFPKDKILVRYSPERIMHINEYVENENLSHIINSKNKYFLLLNANRFTKNPDKVIRAFKKYAANIDQDANIVTVGYPKSLYQQHIILPYLSESDLGHAISNCYALIFPSFFEGFGYPPIEAMKYGKPVFASNVTSIPEVLGDAPIYFAPLYESGIYKALTILNEENYEFYSKKSLQRYAIISRKQRTDLTKLIDLILTDQQNTTK